MLFPWPRTLFFSSIPLEAFFLEGHDYLSDILQHGASASPDVCQLSSTSQPLHLAHLDPMDEMTAK